MWRGLRTRAIRRAEQWMLERTRYTGGVAAIYPPMMYVIMALDLLGYPEDHPDVKEAEQQFFNLLVDDRARFLFPAVFFGGLGYRDRGLRAGRIGSCAGSGLDARAPIGC